MLDDGPAVVVFEAHRIKGVGLLHKAAGYPCKVWGNECCQYGCSERNTFTCSIFKGSPSMEPIEPPLDPHRVV